MIVKTANVRFRARLKSGRQFVASRTFDTKREASEWLARERAALSGGVDPRAGRRLVRSALDEWLEVRAYTVSAKTYRSDQALRRLTPTSILALQISAGLRARDRAVLRGTHPVRAGRIVGHPLPG